MPGKRVQIDDDTWASLNTLAKDRMSTFQELFDEGMCDLLKKQGIPASLKEASSKSAARHEAKERKKRQNVIGGPPNSSLSSGVDRSSTATPKE